MWNALISIGMNVLLAWSCVSLGYAIGRRRDSKRWAARYEELHKRFLMMIAAREEGEQPIGDHGTKLVYGPLEKPPSACAYKDCAKAGMWQPVLKVWAKSQPVESRDSTNCLEMEMGMALCAEHRHLATMELVDDNGWAGLEDALQFAGKAQPDRESAKIELRPIPGQN